MPAFLHLTLIVEKAAILDFYHFYDHNIMF